ncbi:MAG: hypothetical protein K1X75_06065 [Leptospirales bacterium]|nr:hypothetical protein [Leptospirales bacterium]
MGYAPPPRLYWIAVSIVALIASAAGCIGIVDQGIEPNKNGESFPAYPTSGRRLWIPYLPPAPLESAPDNLDSMSSEEQHAAEEAVVQFGFYGLQTAEAWQEQSQRTRQNLAYQALTSDEIEATVSADWDRGSAGEETPLDVEALVQSESAAAAEFGAAMEQSLPAMSIDELKALRRYLASALVIAETSRLNNDPEYGIPEEIFELSIENLLAYRTKVNEELRRRGVHRIE